MGSFLGLAQTRTCGQSWIIHGSLAKLTWYLAVPVCADGQVGICLNNQHERQCDVKDRTGKGYIAVPAYKGSLAEAKGACDCT
eukprot:1139644-Pelagomonas_calceolata.AAC.1